MRRGFPSGLGHLVQVFTSIDSSSDFSISKGENFHEPAENEQHHKNPSSLQEGETGT